MRSAHLLCECATVTSVLIQPQKNCQRRQSNEAMRFYISARNNTMHRSSGRVIAAIKTSCCIPVVSIPKSTIYALVSLRITTLAPLVTLPLPVRAFQAAIELRHNRAQGLRQIENFSVTQQSLKIVDLPSQVPVFLH